MRKLLLLLFLCAMSNLGRAQAGYILYVSSAPSGTCSQGSYQRVVIGPGTVYTCQSGTWAQISGGGGGGTVKFAQTNSSISGWTTGGGGTTPSAVQDLGNPSFSYKIPQNSLLHRDLSGSISNFNSATVDFDFAFYTLSSELCDVLVGMDGSGNGGIALRLDGRGSASTQQIGLGQTTSAFAHTGSTDPTGLAPQGQLVQTMFNHIKIVFNSNATTATWSWNGAAQQANRTVSLAGTNVGFDGDGGSNGCEVMNFTVTQ